MSLVKFPCNQCIQERHDQCTGDLLVKRGFLRNAGEHCPCSRKGHPGAGNIPYSPKIKSIPPSNQKEETVPVKGDEYVTEKDIPFEEETIIEE